MIATALIALGCAVYAVLSARRFGLSQARSLALLGLHVVASFAYMAYLERNDGDALGYFEVGRLGQGVFGVGTAFIGWLSTALFGTLDLSLVDGFLLFGLAGFIGIQVLWLTLREASPAGRPPLALLVIPWLPGLHFWTSALGKDSLAFLAVAMMVHASLRHRERWPAFAAGLLLVTLVRPHVGFIAFTVMLATVVLTGRASAVAKAAIGLAGAMAVALVLPLLADYVGLADVGSLAGLSSGIEERQGYNLEGGSSVDIAQLSLPEQLFTYLFRPLFYDAGSSMMLAASLENLLLLAIFGTATLRLNRLARYADPFAVWFNAALLGALWLVFATTTANLGIAVRQKTMLLPSLVFLAAVCLARSRRAQPARRPAAPLKAQAH